jgi:hypothetical protein
MTRTAKRSNSLKAISTDKDSGRHESTRCDHVGMPDETNSRQALSALKSLRPQQGIDQITQQASSDEGAERIIENHFRSPQRRSQACA